MQRRQFLAFLVAFAVLGCSVPNNKAKISANAKVLAFGDSLTFGHGASSAGATYPAVLGKITGLNVINGGVNGDTSEDGLRRISEMLTNNQPELVLLCLGGNDFLRQIPSVQTKANLIKIIDLIKAQNVQIVLIAVPSIGIGAALGFLSDHEIYKQIAKEKGVLLFEGKWAEILGKSKYKSDQVHANDIGYEKFATDLAEFLRKNGLVK